MGAFIVDVMNNLHSNTLFFLDSTANVAFFEVIPSLSVLVDIPSQRMDNWRISCFLVILLQVVLCLYRILHSLLGLSLSAQVSLRLGSPSQVDTLGKFQLRRLNNNYHSFPWLSYFFFCCIHSLD